MPIGWAWERSGFGEEGLSAFSDQLSAAVHLDLKIEPFG
jgi:hypothetical protein